MKNNPTLGTRQNLCLNFIAEIHGLGGEANNHQICKRFAALGDELTTNQVSSVLNQLRTKGLIVAIGKGASNTIIYRVTAPETKETQQPGHQPPLPLGVEEENEEVDPCCIITCFVDLIKSIARDVYKEEA